LLLNVVEEEESSVVSQANLKKRNLEDICWTTQAWTSTGLKT
jgi:hypothetical protein